MCCRWNEMKWNVSAGWWTQHHLTKEKKFVFAKRLISWERPFRFSIKSLNWFQTKCPYLWTANETLTHTHTLTMNYEDNLKSIKSLITHDGERSIVYLFCSFRTQHRHSRRMEWTFPVLRPPTLMRLSLRLWFRICACSFELCCCYFVMRLKLNNGSNVI